MFGSTRNIVYCSITFMVLCHSNLKLYVLCIFKVCYYEQSMYAFSNTTIFSCVRMFLQQCSTEYKTYCKEVPLLYEVISVCPPSTLSLMNVSSQNVHIVLLLNRLVEPAIFPPTSLDYFINNGPLAFEVTIISFTIGHTLQK